MTTCPELYLLGEIVAEGDLYNCSGYLRQRLSWTTDRFRIAVEEAYAADLTKFYCYSGSAILDVSIDKIDFANDEALMSVNFSPTDAGWTAYNMKFREEAEK